MAFEKANVEAHKETSEKAPVTVAPTHSVDDIPTVAVPTEAKVVKVAPEVAKAPAVAKPAVAKVAYPGHYLKVGAKDPEVKYLQTKLKVATTGIFDIKTEQAVKVLQKKHGLLVDGIVGPKTWAKLG